MPPNYTSLTTEQINTILANQQSLGHIAWSSAEAPAPQSLAVVEEEINYGFTSEPMSVNKAKFAAGPSLDRVFYLTMADSVVVEQQARKRTHGLLETAVLDCETKAAREGQSFYVFKCVGKIEYKKPEFKENEDDGS